MTNLNSSASCGDDMPDCWNDDTRMTSLFAPFRDRNLNPQGWESKFSFWSAMIFKWCEKKNRVSFNIEELNKEFMRNGRIPECLPTVLQEMQRNKSILQPSELMGMCQSPASWKGWVFDLAVKRPVSWSFGKIKGLVYSPSITSQTQFVHLASIKSKCDTIFSSAKENLRGELMSIQTLLNGCNMQNVPALDAMLIAHHLQYQGYAAIIDQTVDATSEPLILVKLRTVNMKNRPVVTDVDRGIYTLSCNEKALVNYIERLEKEKQETVAQAKAYLAKGMRSTAKSCLRKKKELEKVIDKRSSALDNVQVLLARIRDASSDSQVLESYQVGVAALKQTFKSAGLTEDDVANTMDEVQEVLDTHNEIQALLSEPVDSSTDEGLEDELEELLMQEHKPGPGSDGNLNDGDKDLEDRLKQLRVNDSQPASPTLPATPKGVTLSDLPDAPCHMPTPNLSPL